MKIIEKIDKETSMKPIRKIYPMKDEPDWIAFYCPRCDTKLCCASQEMIARKSKLVSPSFNYCLNCGQKVDLSEYK